MKKNCFLLLLISFVSTTNTKAQLLKKLKQKAEQAIDKTMDKTVDKKTGNKEENTDAGETGEANGTTKAKAGSSLKVYSKFDFVPGSTVLYYDNFEKDNIGEAPEGWITNTSAEVVTIEGLEGKWVKMVSTHSKNFIRNKKQSWGNNFTIEFDLLLVKDTYDPRIYFELVNTGGNLVTDEGILKDSKKIIEFYGGLFGHNVSGTTLTGLDNKKLSENGSADLPYGNSTPVHISMCVQGKRFRMWWNEKKLFDMPAVNEQYLPNQLAFTTYSTGGFDYYLSNIRVAKDVPDTRAKFEEGKLVSNLLFYTGTAKLKPESLGALLDVSKVIKEAPDPVKIVGHTDSDGDDASNQKLSQERAETVKDILQKEYGIDESKLTTEGRGETQPIAENSHAEGKAQNRRVEFIFKPEADKYIKQSGTKTGSPSKQKPATGNSKSNAVAATETSVVKLESKILSVNLPYAQFVKKSESEYSFIASKEEGNGRENYFKIELETAGAKLKPETFNFDEINRKQPMYGTKKFSSIKNSEAVLYYGASKKPYISQFSPVVANGHMAGFVMEDLVRKMPSPSPNCKLVIEKLEDGKASGYFTVGIMIEGLKPVTKGDAMQQTFTNGYSGEMKCSFSNVPVY